MDDAESYFIPNKNQVLASQYQVLSTLGKGTFGTVFACLDMKTNQDVAIKVIRAIDKYYHAGLAELNAIMVVNDNRYNVNSQIITLLNNFEFDGHLCLVFPKFGFTLLDLLKANGYKGYNLDWTRELSKAFMNGVYLMHQKNLIHTDIKPENIMSRQKPISTQVRDRVFVHPPGADLVLIDLGSTVQVKSSKRPQLVCTRQYRPPEIMLGNMDWDERLDVWSCGCVLFETATGRTLFRTHNSVVHMCLMEKILGPMPKYLLDPSRCKYYEYYQNSMWVIPSDTEDTERYSYNVSKTIEEELEGHKYAFIHLIKWMLHWDYRYRPNVKQVLEHPFFNEVPRDTKCIQVGEQQNQNYGLLRSTVSDFLEGFISYDEFKRWFAGQQ